MIPISDFLKSDTTQYMHPLGCTILGRNWCSEAAGVSFNLHWLFHCVTNTHLTDGSTQRIAEPCRLLGNTCPLLQTFHNHTHYLNSTPTYEQRHWCWLMQLLPQQKRTCSFGDWYSAHGGRNNVSSRMQDKVLQLQQFHQGWQVPDESTPPPWHEQPLSICILIPNSFSPQT